MHVAIVARGASKFGIRDATFKELVSEAGHALFEDISNLEKKDIDGLFVGSAMPERFINQGYVAPIVAEQLGLEPRIIVRSELACASGQAAMRAAYASIKSGMCRIAFVLGIEKMVIPSNLETQRNLSCILDTEWDSIFGLSAPTYFAMCAQRHMFEFRTTPEQMALVSVKNRRHASRNPRAHFQKGVTVGEVLGSRMVSSPLHLLECSPISDGASAVIMVREEDAKIYTDAPAYIIGHGQCCMGSLVGNLSSLSKWLPLKVAAKEAYDSSGLRPSDIDIAEIHDCFSISEIMAYEGLGFCRGGEGGKFIEDGRSCIGGDVAINTRGGLLGAGHPLGATGVAQAVEILEQFRGQVEDSRYVSGAEHALSHNLSGNANTHSILVYGRD